MQVSPVSANLGGLFSESISKPRTLSDAPRSPGKADFWVAVVFTSFYMLLYLMSVVCMSVLHVHEQCPQRHEKGLSYSRL